MTTPRAGLRRDRLRRRDPQDGHGHPCPTNALQGLAKRWGVRWHVEGDAFDRALAVVVEAQAALPMAAFWGPGGPPPATASSSRPAAAAKPSTWATGPSPASRRTRTSAAAQPLPGLEPLLRRQPGARPGAEDRVRAAVHGRAASAGEGAAGPARGRAASTPWRGPSTGERGRISAREVYDQVCLTLTKAATEAAAEERREAERERGRGRQGGAAAGDAREDTGPTVTSPLADRSPETNGPTSTATGSTSTAAQPGSSRPCRPLTPSPSTPPDPTPATDPRRRGARRACKTMPASVVG